MTKMPLYYPSNTNNYKSILCLNGTLPERDFFNVDLPIIAADGAANKLVAMNITPQMVVGDLDSIDPDNLAKLNSYYHYDQNYCDFQKSLWYLEKNNLLPTIIVGINGGFLDHVLNNINIFLSGNNLLYAPPLSGFCLQGGQEKILSLPLNTKISLLGIPSAKLSTNGLTWDLNEATLSFPGNTSCFNRVNEQQILVNVHEGNVLILIYDDLQ